MPRDGKGLQIHALFFETQIITAFDRYIALLVKMSVDFPVWFCLSLLEVKGYEMFTDNNIWSREVNRIDRDELTRISHIQLAHLRLI